MHRILVLLLLLSIPLAAVYAADGDPPNTVEVIQQIVANADKGFRDFKGEQRGDGIWTPTIKLPGAIFGVITWIGSNERSRTGVQYLMAERAQYDKARATFSGLYTAVREAFPDWGADAYEEDKMHQHILRFFPPGSNSTDDRTPMVSLAMIPLPGGTFKVLIAFRSPRSPREAADQEREAAEKQKARR
jgi:hypothetical protein